MEIVILNEVKNPRLLLGHPPFSFFQVPHPGMSDCDCFGKTPTSIHIDGQHRAPLQSFRRASRSTCPVHMRKLKSSHREAHTKAKVLPAVSVSAFLPEKVSILHRRYGLRHGVSR
ncbi:MAG: hypothetical protein WAL75_15955 [Terracidiphilus sp.]